MIEAIPRRVVIEHGNYVQVVLTHRYLSQQSSPLPITITGIDQLSLWRKGLELARIPSNHVVQLANFKCFTLRVLNGREIFLKVYAGAC